MTYYIGRKEPTVSNTRRSSFGKLFQFLYIFKNKLSISANLN